MNDVKLKNGEIALDAAGNAEILGDRDAHFQRAYIRMTAKRGKFIYDRELGADVIHGTTDMPERKNEQLFNEALALCADATARYVSYTGRGVMVEVDSNGEKRTMEVVRYG